MNNQRNKKLKEGPCGEHAYFLLYFLSITRELRYYKKYSSQASDLQQSARAIRVNDHH